MVGKEAEITKHPNRSGAEIAVRDSGGLGKEALGESVTDPSASSCEQ
jgi:hypothetical protein